MQHSGIRIGNPRKDQHISRDLPRNFRPHTSTGFAELCVPGGRKTPENNAPLSVVGAGKGQRPVNPFRRGSDGFPESDSPLDGVFLTSTGDEEDRREQPHWGHARTGLPSSTARERSLGGRPNDFAAHSPTVAFSPAQDADASTRHASGNAFPSQRAQSAARHRPDQAPDDDALFRWTDQAPRPGTAPLAGERRRSASPAVGTASPSVGAALWQRTTNSMHAVGLAATAVARLQQRKRQPPSTSGLRHAALKCENAVLNYRHLSRPITPGGSASLGTTGKYGDGARDAVLIALKAVSLHNVLSEKHLQYIATEAVLRRFEGGEVMVREHEDPAALLILVSGSIGEYEGVHAGYGAVVIADPIRLSHLRVASHHQPHTIFCLLSALTGACSGTLLAALSPCSVLRVPAVAYQPLFANDHRLISAVAREAVTLIALLEDTGPTPTRLDNGAPRIEVLPRQEAFSPGGRSLVLDTTHVSLAADIAKYHAGLVGLSAGASWDLSPRGMLKEPRAAMKIPDREPIPLTRKVIEPCVGSREALQLPPGKHDPPPDTMVVDDDLHLTPRFVARDNAGGGSCSYGLSRKPLALVVQQGKKGAVGDALISLAGGAESWLQQGTIVEQPVVKPAGSGHLGFTSYFGAKGSTQEVLDAMTGDDKVAPRTSLDTKLHRLHEAHRALSKQRASFQCSLSHEPHGSDMQRQLQFEASRAAHPTAFRCAQEVAKTEDQLAATKLAISKESLSNLGGRQQASFECTSRNTFIPADMRALVLHRQYPSERAEASAFMEVTGRDAIDLEDARIKRKFTIPNAPTASMLQATPHLLREEIFRKPNEKAPDPEQPLTSSTLFRPASARSPTRRSPAELASRKVESAASEWSSVARIAETTGLLPRKEKRDVPPNAPAQRAPFSAQLRKASPYFVEHGRLKVRDTHTFSSPLAFGAFAGQPSATISASQEDQIAALQPKATVKAVEDYHAEREPTWVVQLKFKKQSSDMATMLRAMEDRAVTRTRTAPPDGRDPLEPRREQPPWACLERQRRH